MRIFFKYLLWFLSLLALVTFFLVGTRVGHQLMGDIVEDYLCLKTKNKINVESFNIAYYPKLILDMQVNGGARVHLEGKASRDSIDMHYHLVGDEYRWNRLYIDSHIDVKGKLQGSLKSLRVKGEGAVFNGDVNFTFVKKERAYEGVEATLSGVDMEPLLKSLHYKPLLKGKAEIKSHFEHLSTYEKVGESQIYMKQGFMPTVAPFVPFELNASILFDKITYKAEGTIESDIGRLKLNSGYYHTSQKYGKVNYDLKIKNLVYFEKFLKHRYVGELNTTGVLEYKDSDIFLKGKTDRFGGLLYYTYADKNLELKLQGVFLERLLKEYNYPALLKAKVYGDIEYDINDKIVIINTELKEARFRETKMTNMIYRATGINMLNDVYDQSSFVAGYQNERLSAILKIDNGVNHIYLNNIIMNAKTNRIDANYHLLMYQEELVGKIYGTLEHPRVSVDMRELFKSQVKKRFSGWFKREKKEQIKRELKERASSFMNEIFD